MNLTVIIACKDRGRNVERCLASIDSCSPSPRTVLVDFGSRVPLNDYDNKYKWLKVIRVNRNVQLFHKTRALNIGIRAATTRFVCLTDVDQVFQPNFFHIVNSTLLNGPNAFIRCNTYFLPSVPAFLRSGRINWQIYRRVLKIVKNGAHKSRMGKGAATGYLGNGY